MLILKAFQYEVMANGESLRSMRRFAGCRRFVFNKALALQDENYNSGGKFISYAVMCKHLTEWRNSAELGWLSDAPVHTQQQALKDLDGAYKKFFKKLADRPTFKKKGISERFRYPDPKQFEIDEANARIKLPKLGWIRYRKSRAITGTAKNVTVRLSAGKWLVSIQTEQEVVQPLPSAVSAVGIDVGVSRFATLSDGSHVDALSSFKKHQQRLAKYQRRMSRKVKFSSNWRKAKAKVSKLHHRIANVRNDFLHKTSTTISKNHALVCVEDLKVRNMTASAKGTVEQPGSKVRQKAGLNRSILDQGWGEFRRQLEYKFVWNGGMLIAVPPHYTSQKCPCCGHVSAENRKTQAQFACIDCGYENHADLVGAINILSLGMKKLGDEGQDTSDASLGRNTAAQIACEVSGAIRPPAAGTRRSDCAGGSSCTAQ